MPNPAGFKTINPSNTMLTVTQKAGNAFVGVDNVTQLPNVTNPKSLGQPSANGYTEAVVNPKYIKYAGTPSTPVTNEPQAVQTTATTAPSLGLGFKIFNGVSSLIAAPYVIADVANAFGYLANLGQISKNYSEKERLDKLLAQREAQAKAQLANKIDSSSTGIAYTVALYVTDFIGGCDGGLYELFYDYGLSLPSPPSISLEDVRSYPSCDGATGSIKKLIINGVDSGFRPQGISMSISVVQFAGTQRPTIFWNWRPVGTGGAQYPPSSINASNSNTVNTPPLPAPPAQEWLYGEVPVTVSGGAAAILDRIDAKAKASFPKISTPANAPSPVAKLDPVPPKTPNPTLTPIGANSTGTAIAQNANPTFPHVASNTNGVRRLDTPSQNFKSVAANQTTASQTYANGQTNETYSYSSSQQLVPTTKPVDKPTPITTQPYVNPNSPDIGGLAAGIVALGLTAGAIATGIDYLKNLNNQINNQTSAANQQANAKEGSCQAMNSPSCTSGLEGRIKDPINQNVNDKTGALNALLSGINTALSAFITAATSNFDKILRFLDNSIVDRAIGAANFAMNVHNALMLSNALGKTLAGVVDTAMNAAGFQFVNTSGQRTSASAAFSSNVSALIVNLIGQDLYTELTDDWKVANRIYQGITNLANKTERLLAGQSKIAQKSGIDVANIGNALRANGIVNANSYPPMAATKEANTPSELLADVNTPLSSIQSGAKNLNAITKSVAGTIKQASAIQKEFGKLADLTNKESKIRKSMRTKSAADANRKAKFTLPQIRIIKQSGKK